MKKIMFNDRYGLTNAVIRGEKTMTRRAVGRRLTTCDIMAYNRGRLKATDITTAQYRVGEIVAIAQAYKDITPTDDFLKIEKEEGKPIIDVAGWRNKMFVKAEYMPHQLQITDIFIEHLQEIPDDDCFREGICRKTWGWNEEPPRGDNPAHLFYFRDLKPRVHTCPSDVSPRRAFKMLIDRVSGKGTWELDPYVFVYSFILIK